MATTYHGVSSKRKGLIQCLKSHISFSLEFNSLHIESHILFPNHIKYNIDTSYWFSGADVYDHQH